MILCHASATFSILSGLFACNVPRDSDLIQNYTRYFGFKNITLILYFLYVRFSLIYTNKTVEITH